MNISESIFESSSSVEKIIPSDKEASTSPASIIDSSAAVGSEKSTLEETQQSITPTENSAPLIKREKIETENTGM